jgi:hypothetical protein
VGQEVPMPVKMGKKGLTFGLLFLIAQIIYSNLIGIFIFYYSTARKNIDNNLKKK